MSGTDGLIRKYEDGATYGICIEHIPGKKRPVLTAQIGTKYSVAKLKVAEITDEDSLRMVFQGLFGGDWE